MKDNQDVIIESLCKTIREKESYIKLLEDAIVNQRLQNIKGENEDDKTICRT